MDGAKDPEKARRAARHPDRPGEDCRAAPGRWVPLVNRARCEGKGDCVEVCPYAVFEMGRLTDHELRELSPLVRIKQWLHGKKTARTPGDADCRGCGLCVVACPEQAIRLTRQSE